MNQTMDISLLTTQQGMENTRGGDTV